MVRNAAHGGETSHSELANHADMAYVLPVLADEGQEPVKSLGSRKLELVAAVEYLTSFLRNLLADIEERILDGDGLGRTTFCGVAIEAQDTSALGFFGQLPVYVEDPTCLLVRVEQGVAVNLDAQLRRQFGQRA